MLLLYNLLLFLHNLLRFVVRSFSLASAEIFISQLGSSVVAPKLILAISGVVTFFQLIIKSSGSPSSAFNINCSPLTALVSIPPISIKLLITCCTSPLSTVNKSLYTCFQKLSLSSAFCSPLSSALIIAVPC